MIWKVFFIINFCLFIIKLESINYTDFGFTCKYLFSVDMVMGKTGQLHLNIILVIRYFLYVLLKVGIRVSVWNNIIYWKLICCLGNCSPEKVVRRKKKTYLLSIHLQIYLQNKHFLSLRAFNYDFKILCFVHKSR